MVVFLTLEHWVKYFFLLTVEISSNGSFMIEMIPSLTSKVAVAVNAINGTPGKWDLRSNSSPYSGLMIQQVTIKRDNGCLYVWLYPLLTAWLTYAHYCNV